MGLKTFEVFVPSIVGLRGYLKTSMWTISLILQRWHQFVQHLYPFPKMGDLFDVDPAYLLPSLQDGPVVIQAVSGGIDQGFVLDHLHELSVCPLELWLAKLPLQRRLVLSSLLV